MVRLRRSGAARWAVTSFTSSPLVPLRSVGGPGLAYWGAGWRVGLVGVTLRHLSLLPVLFHTRSLGSYHPHPILHPPTHLAHPQSLYVDMRQVVQMHVSVEEIGMRSTRWSTVSHGVRYVTLQDGTMGLETTPKQVLGQGRGWEQALLMALVRQ